MRIISRQKDYYDNVMQYGMDLSLQYVRQPRAEAAKDWSNSVSLPSRFSSTWHYIGFCGTVYTALEIAPLWYSSTFLSHNRLATPEHMIYDMDHLDAFMEKHLQKLELDYYYGREIPKNKIRSVAFGPTRKSLSFDFQPSRWVGYQKYFTESRAPIWVVSGSHRIKLPKEEVTGWKDWVQGIVYNPLLNQFNFGKIKDAYTAFQDIRMWLSNQAEPEKPIPKMTNAEDAARLGHDSPYSFRKAPSKK